MNLWFIKEAQITSILKMKFILAVNKQMQIKIWLFLTYILKE